MWGRKNKMLKKQLKNTLIGIVIFLAVSLVWNVYFIFDLYENENVIEVERIEVENTNETYKETLENYYNIEYEKTGKGVKFEINNPCLEIQTSTGTSMLPLIEEKSLAITDACFPVENLKLNDIIVFYKLKSESDIYLTEHRIIEIDYDEKWVITKGDNNQYNDTKRGFEFIYGKVIGTLNVLEYKELVRRVY